MALDSTVGGVSAESYLSVADCDSYHSLRSNTAWAALSTGAKEAALRKATDYLVQSFHARWKGSRASITQALDWPREGVAADTDALGYPQQFLSATAIPVEVQKATAELALKAATASLSSDVAPDMVTEKTVGDITVKYSGNLRRGGQKAYAAVEGFLAPLLLGGAGQIRMMRA